MVFQSVDPAGQRLTGRALSRRLVLAMIKRRAAGADLPASTCCHTFRATGITAYLSNGGTLEGAHRIAGHASPKTLGVGMSPTLPRATRWFHGGGSRYFQVRDSSLSYGTHKSICSSPKPVASSRKRRPLAVDNCQWQPKTAHFWQLKTAHFRGGLLGRIRTCSCQVPPVATPKTDPRRNGVCRSTTGCNLETAVPVRRAPNPAVRHVP